VFQQIDAFLASLGCIEFKVVFEQIDAFLASLGFVVPVSSYGSWAVLRM
jgi:hypothetical protein